MTCFPIGANEDIAPAIAAAQWKDTLLFEDGSYAMPDLMEIHTTNLTFKAKNLGMASFYPRLEVNLCQVTFDGLDVLVDDCRALTMRDSRLWFDDSRFVAVAGNDQMAAQFDNCAVYFRANNRLCVHDWSASGCVEFVQLLYGTQIWCSTMLNFSHFIKTPSVGSGVLINITQGGGFCYFHNTRIGAGLPTAKGNGITCMAMQRGSGIRITSDATCGGSTGFLNGGVAIAQSGESIVDLEGMGPTGLNRVYLTSFDKGVVQTGPGGRLVEKNIYTSNTTTPWTLDSEGWTRI
jgi:hypothetical protein